jgi:hypothetical protein
VTLGLDLAAAARTVREIGQMAATDVGAADTRLIRLTHYPDRVLLTPAEENGELVHAAEVQLTNTRPPWWAAGRCHRS